MPKKNGTILLKQIRIIFFFYNFIDVNIVVLKFLELLKSLFLVRHIIFYSSRSGTQSRAIDSDRVR